MNPNPPVGPTTTAGATTPAGDQHQPAEMTQQSPVMGVVAKVGDRATAGAESATSGLTSAADEQSRRQVKRAIENPTRTQSESAMRAYADKWLFALFLVLGFTGIFALKHTTIDPKLVSAAAVGGMIAYGCLAWFVPRIPPRPDRLGDNLYYMGFVFTLASMSAALVDLQGGADVSTLIGSFGIALFSTIAGISGRVLLQQMRTEVEDVEQVMRRELINAAHQLKGQLGLAVNDLESFRLGVKQKVEIQLQESLDDHRRASQEHLRSLENLIKDLLQRLGGTFASHNDTLHQLAASTGDTVLALRGVIERFDAIRPPLDILDRKLDPTFERIGKVLAGYEDAAAADRKRQEALTETVKQFRDAISDISRQPSTFSRFFRLFRRR